MTVLAIIPINPATAIITAQFFTNFLISSLRFNLTHLVICSYDGWYAKLTLKNKSIKYFFTEA